MTLATAAQSLAFKRRFVAAVSAALGVPFAAVNVTKLTASTTTTSTTTASGRRLLGGVAVAYSVATTSASASTLSAVLTGR